MNIPPSGYKLPLGLDVVAGTSRPNPVKQRIKDKQPCKDPPIPLARWAEWGFEPQRNSQKRTNNGEIITNPISSSCSTLSQQFANDIGVLYHTPQKDHGFLIQKKFTSGESSALCLVCHKEYFIKPLSPEKAPTNRNWESRYCIIIEDELHIINFTEIENIKSTLPSIQIRTIMLAPTMSSYAHEWYPRT